MLVRESGVEMLKDLLATCHWSPCHDVPHLAQQVISRCERFADDSDYVTDDEQDNAGMNE